MTTGMVAALIAALAAPVWYLFVRNLWFAGGAGTLTALLPVLALLHHQMKSGQDFYVELVMLLLIAGLPAFGAAAITHILARLRQPW